MTETGLNLTNKRITLGMQGFPTHATFEITRRCNAVCDYCYLEDKSAELDLNSIKFIIDKISNEGILFVLITGGEPFIRADILDILGHFIEKNFFQISMLSNGTLVSDEHIRFLSEHSRFFGQFRFSFFSHIPEIHDSYMGVPHAFEKALQTVHRLIDAGLSVTVTLNILQSNVESYQESKTFFENRGLRVKIGNSKFLPTEYLKKKYGVCTTAEFNRKFFAGLRPETLKKMKKRAEEDFHNSPGKVKHVCRGMFTGIMVLASGDFSPCILFRKALYGNLIKDNRPIQKIITDSELFRNLKKLHEDLLPECKECSLIKYCKICPGATSSETGTFFTPNRKTCNYTHALNEALKSAE